MNIHAEISTLTGLKKEIALRSKEIGKLRKEAKIKEANIITYLKEKDQHGVKFNGNALIMNTKPKPVAKPKKLKEESYLRVLEEAGVPNPENFLKELFNAGKEEKEVTNLKIQKIK